MNEKKTSIMTKVKFTRLTFLLLFTLFAVNNPLFAQAPDGDAAAALPAGLSADPAVIAKGKEIFTGNCTSCHAVHEKVIGPALFGVWDRAPSREWIYNFVKNSTKVIKSGDPYAVKLYNEYKKTQMTSFQNYGPAEVDAVLSYINSVKPPEPPTTISTTDGGGTGTSTQADGGYTTAILTILIIVLVLILIVLGLMVNVLTKFLQDKEDLAEEDKEVVNQKSDLGKFFTSNGVIGIFIFIIVALSMKAGIDGLFTVGVQQNYQPRQPIAFSHEIHAGQYEIDCNYCHTGVRKAKSANIPSANICMNCHSAIKTESPEIAKIYKAIDFDPETGEYGENTKPIEWVRIHNLPDLAYFNHSQHVEVAKLECETCHGEIKEMEVVYQYAPLTMGWCINCHRETDVNTKGNGYYTKLVQLHKESKGGKTPMKVEDIGGLECSKCHY